MSKRTAISGAPGTPRPVAVSHRAAIALGALACCWGGLFATDFDWVPDLPVELHDDLARALLAATIVAIVAWVLKKTGLRRPAPVPAAAARPSVNGGGGYAEGVIDGLALRAAGADDEPTRDLSASLKVGNLAVIRPRRH